ncbi:hypothetical protein [Deinococcus sp. YIM 77859]|uniref:hypothetical protein n=1 Tax=Deinococcus sp. YIM 77859 TaxID=1540221 RepID=UPI0012E00AF2|nr:hypothetical protein [Deinococcus sp. YIM 77859]
MILRLRRIWRDTLTLLGGGGDFTVVPTVLADARARSADLQRRLPWLLPSWELLFLAGVVGLAAVPVRLTPLSPVPLHWPHAAAAGRG